MNEWLRSHLVCPRDKQPLEFSDNQLICPEKHLYHVFEGIPVMLVDEAEAIELAGRQSVDALFRFARHGFWLSTAVRQAVRTLQRDSSPTQHFDTTPRAPESPMSLWHPI